MTKKVVLVTGSSRGIGKAIAVKFAREGYHVILNCARRERELLCTKKEIERLHASSCLSFLGDMGDFPTCKKLFSQIRQQYQSLDVLVNNAGISYMGLLQDMEPQEWEAVIRTNLTSAFHCCKLAVPIMLSAGRGKIINISSVWGLVGSSCEVAYSASKGGLNAFTLALAKELAPSNIQVNAVACGAIDTEMNQWMDEEEQANLSAQIPAGRMGRAEEVAQLVYGLSSQASYLTGQVVKLDGGWV